MLLVCKLQGRERASREGWGWAECALKLCTAVPLRLSAGHTQRGTACLCPAELNERARRPTGKVALPAVCDIYRLLSKLRGGGVAGQLPQRVCVASLLRSKAAGRSTFRGRRGQARSGAHARYLPSNRGASGWRAADLRAARRRPYIPAGPVCRCRCRLPLVNPVQPGATRLLAPPVVDGPVCLAAGAVGARGPPGLQVVLAPGVFRVFCVLQHDVAAPGNECGAAGANFGDMRTSGRAAGLHTLVMRGASAGVACGADPPTAPLTSRRAPRRAAVRVRTARPAVPGPPPAACPGSACRPTGCPAARRVAASRPARPRHPGRSAGRRHGGRQLAAVAPAGKEADKPARVAHTMHSLRAAQRLSPTRLLHAVLAGQPPVEVVDACSGGCGSARGHSEASGAARQAGWLTQAAPHVHGHTSMSAAQRAQATCP